jgi:hypothetical protein
MAYNYNPNFSKHMEINKSNIKFLKQLRNNENFNYKPTSIKMRNFVHTELEEIQKYKIADIDNPNGWAFNEIDTLGHMGFKMDDDYDLSCEVEIPSLELEDHKQTIKVYKEEDGYVLETSRRYVFETFNKLIEFIDSIPSRIF